MMWEYKVTSTYHSHHSSQFLAKLNELGEMGWEVYQIRTVYSTTYIYAKRRKQ